MGWTILGSKPEGLEHVRKNYKRPAEKDDAFLTLPKKRIHRHETRLSASTRSRQRIYDLVTENPMPSGQLLPAGW